MCGITGIQVFHSEHASRLSLIHAATSRLNKRGPDDEGVYTHHHTALGHRRLSIIDISKAGAQPFTDPSGRYTLVLNGEFFNYREHREKLISRGVSFRSESDTEVLLHLWILEKEACLSKVNGFFAFSVYDREEESLCLVRDRYGVKPLLYAFDDKQFVFASEMKALLEFPVSREIDSVSLQTYLHLNYIPSPNSIFKAVKKLEPGCILYVHPGKCEIKPYYQLSGSVTEPPPSYPEAMEKVRMLTEDAVQKRLTSDVPLGAFLSGGIDSSVITALASRHTPHLKTFSIGFPDEPLFDETRFAEAVARKFGTSHTTFPVRNSELFENLTDALDYLDEPFADSSALLVFILCRHTKTQVTVALSGDGADELFTGYNKHAAEYRMLHRGIQELGVQAGKSLWALLPMSRNTVLGNKVRQLHKFSTGMNLSAEDRYWQWAGFAQGGNAKNLLLKQGDQEEYRKRKENLSVLDGPGFNALLKADFNLVLQNDMLVKTDMMSMANGLELRSPFLDYRLVDYVFSLPDEYKIDGKSRKKILKDAFKNVLPDEILARKKQGFEAPLLKWFRTELKALLFDDLLGEQNILSQGIFDLSEIEKLKKQLFSSSPEDSVARIWALLVFQHWWRKYGTSPMPNA